MVRGSRVVMKNGGEVLNKTLSQILVCPLTKQSLRYCDKTCSLVSDQIGVSFPIVDGIPHLVPKDGKFLDDNEVSDSGTSAKSSRTE